MQHFEQALAVQAQIHLLGIDHHAIKECIHWQAQGSQDLQAGGVVTGLKLGRRFGQQFLHGGVEIFLSVFLQQHRIDVGVHLSRFFQDVADAFVGRSQCGTFGQGREGADGLQTYFQIAPGGHAVGMQSGFNFGGRVSPIFQITAKSVLEELFQDKPIVFQQARRKRALCHLVQLM